MFVMIRRAHAWGSRPDKARAVVVVGYLLLDLLIDARVAGRRDTYGWNIIAVVLDPGVNWHEMLQIWWLQNKVLLEIQACGSFLCYPISVAAKMLSSPNKISLLLAARFDSVLWIGTGMAPRTANG